jgi:ethanolamine utilization cobalamin adenosyltransferase
MLFKYFIDKDTKTSVSVNPNRVKYVRETEYGTKIVFDDGSYVVVDEDFLGTTTRLSEF